MFSVGIKMEHWAKMGYYKLGQIYSMSGQVLQIWAILI